MDNAHALHRTDALDAAAEDFLENIAPELFDLIIECEPASHRSLTILNWIDDLQDDRTEALTAEGLARVLRAVESLVDARVRGAHSDLPRTAAALFDQTARPGRDVSGTTLALATLAHVHLIAQLAYPKVSRKLAMAARSFHRSEIERIAAIFSDVKT